MNVLVLSIDISPQERTRLCTIAAEDVSQQSGALVDAAARYEAYDNTAAPYIRAVYVHCADTVVAERVAVMAGCDCGFYLRDALQAAVSGIKGPTVACWLTVTLEDTCILEHVVFAISSDLRASPIVAPADGVVHQHGTLPSSLLPVHPQSRSTSGGYMYKADDRALSETAPVLPPREAVAADPPSPPPHPPNQGLQAHARPPPQTTPPTRSPYKQTEKSQTDAARHPASSTQRNIRAAPFLLKATHTPFSLDSGAVAPPIGGPGSSVSTSSHTTPTTRSQPTPASHLPSSMQTSTAGHRSHIASQNVPRGTAPPPSATKRGLHHSGSDLVVPSDGQRSGDRAFRTRYAARREELWDIADAVMTHNYPAENDR